jgi:hypothetical protein
MKQIILTLCGALVGGILGYLAFFWIASQGFYVMVLPGGLLGLGASIGKPRSLWLAGLCGLAATALGLFTEWRYAPFKKDDSLVFFLQHIHHLEPITLLMIALGGAMGFWVPFRRRETDTRPPAGKSVPEKADEGAPEMGA